MYLPILYVKSTFKQIEMTDDDTSIDSSVAVPKLGNLPKSSNSNSRLALTKGQNKWL